MTSKIDVSVSLKLSGVILMFLDLLNSEKEKKKPNNNHHVSIYFF